ncbi:hypothetical protein [Falsarthrobacter nasiphocae]|uniref:Uncharacterized protein n=1 Tax=Falsarthrobacter nasiphocae TaxID=189863 RepID=A0AAE3YDT0_9MICC|nr:hypothetical protein [Falsarthrobacter nasiphocae]MDR6892008.1 hypothetical protein [Falsarthrobacter nasiphocae]
MPASSSLTSITWGSPLWWESVIGWTRETLREQGIELTGGLVVERQTAWRIEAVAPSSIGPLRFVESHAPHRFEGGLLACAGRFVHGFVNPVVALDEAKARFLVHDDAVPLSLAPAGSAAPTQTQVMRRVGRRALSPTAGLPDPTGDASGDGGTPAPQPSSGFATTEIGDKHIAAEDRAVADAMPEFLPRWAEAQLGLAMHRLDMQQAGAPVMDPSWFPMFVENQIRAHAARPSSDPLHISAEEAARLEAELIPRTQASAQILLDSGIPLMLDPGRIVGTDLGRGSDGLVVRRLPHASIAHPFSALSTAAAARHRAYGDHDEGLAPLVLTYLEAFSRFGTPEELLEVAEHAVRLSPLNDYSASMRIVAGPAPLDEETAARLASLTLDRLRAVGSPPANWAAAFPTLSREEPVAAPIPIRRAARRAR